jgi:hypothetical protein
MRTQSGLQPTRIAQAAVVLTGAAWVAALLWLERVHAPGGLWRELGIERLVDRYDQVCLISLGLITTLLIWSATHERSYRVARSVVFATLLLVLVADTSLAVAHLAQKRDHFFDVGDNFHYYLGTKYFAELGYVRHYECGVVAMEELGRTLPKRVRNLRTDRIVQVRELLTPELRAHCHERFSPERWAEFKRDIRAFRNWHSYSRFAHRFTDHGYNGTPFWTAVSGVVTNAVPVSEGWQNALALLNVIAVSAMGCVVLQLLGWEFGLYFSILFWTTYPDRFVLGGAFLRYAWIALLVSGLACLGRRYYARAGVLIAAASGLLVFPLLFFAAIGLQLGLALARRTRPSPGHVRFAAAGALSLLAVFLISVSHADGLENWSAFLAQMDLHSGRLASGRIGFIYDFIWPKDVTVGQQLDYEPRLAALHAPLLLGLTWDHLRIALGALLVLGVIRVARRLPDMEASTLLGFALFFVGFSTVRYYYAGLCALPLVCFVSFGRATGRLLLASLAALLAACFALQHVTAYSFAYNTLLSFGFTLFLAGCALPPLCRLLVERPSVMPARDPAPASGHVALQSSGVTPRRFETGTERSRL